MKKTALTTTMAIAGLLLFAGIGSASAHGLFRGEFTGAKLDPEEIASHHEEMFASQAELLDIDVAVLKDAWAQGKNLKDIAQEQGIDEETLHERMRALHQQRMQEQLDTLVERGIISQEQAEQRLTHMQERREQKSEQSQKMRRGARGFQNMQR